MNEHQQPCTRRTFLKLSTAGTAGLALNSISCIKPPKRGGDDDGDLLGPVIQNSAWSDRQPVNSQISNKKVAFCYDPEMVSGFPAFSSMEGQNNVIDQTRVYENLDNMAVALTGGTGTAADAWAKIFQKPAGKSWNEVKVALKQNCLEAKNVPRIALIGKICEELHTLGVPYANMTIFDWGRGCTGIYGSDYSKTKLPSPDIKVSNRLGGDAQQVDLPDGSKENCCSDLADGTVDILVNFAVNKGHDDYAGGFTVGMKNHIGSIKFEHPDPIVSRTPNKVIAINHSSQIMGTPDSPRQQLIVVDAIWSARSGPGGSPDIATHCLLMGVHPAMVDYLTVRKVRESAKPAVGEQGFGMGMTNTNQEILGRYLSSYGYDIDSDEIKELDVIDVSV